MERPSDFLATAPPIDSRGWARWRFPAGRGLPAADGASGAAAHRNARKGTFHQRKIWSAF